jgi:predicted nucleic acid-binding protein
VTRFLYDTAVFVYARGAEHAYRAACRVLVARTQTGALVGEASVELVQEYAHILRRRGWVGPAVRQQSQDVAATCLLHDFTGDDLQLALNLVATHPSLSVRDGVHAATALRRGIPVIVSPDRGFDGIAGLERLDPNVAVQRLHGDS